jgi:hypothetical protein
MQLVWAENVVRHTNRPVLVLTPLAVAGQTVREARSSASRPSAPGRQGPAGARVVVTNYERLHHFDPATSPAWSATSRASSRTSTASARRRDRVPAHACPTGCSARRRPPRTTTSSWARRPRPWASWATRTCSPGSSRRRRQKDLHLIGWGGGRRSTGGSRGHAERDFWRWVCSWARACRKPSDLGFDDGRSSCRRWTREHVVKAPRRPRPASCSTCPAVTLEEQREEQRRTLPERCEKVAELVGHTGPAVAGAT